MSPSCGAPLIGSPGEADGTGGTEDPCETAPLFAPPEIAGALLSTVTALFNFLPFLISPNKASLPILATAGLGLAPPVAGPIGGGGGAGGGGGPAMMWFDILTPVEL